MTEVRLEQPEKARTSILVKELGRVIDVRPVCLKAPDPILVTDSGRVIEVSPKHRSKALVPILLTDSGRVIEVSPDHLKASPIISVVPSLTTIFVFSGMNPLYL